MFNLVNSDFYRDDVLSRLPDNREYNRLLDDSVLKIKNLVNEFAFFYNQGRALEFLFFHSQDYCAQLNNFVDGLKNKLNLKIYWHLFLDSKNRYNISLNF